MNAVLTSLDHLRGRALRLLAPWAPTIIARREPRVAIGACLTILAALAGATFAPLLLLAVVPLLLGVPHIAADIRYLWVRPGYARRPLLWLGIGAPLLAAFAASHLTTGLLACLGAVVVARASIARRCMAAAGIVLLILVTTLVGPLADLVFVHGHNFIAVGFWLAWRRREERDHHAPLLLLGGAVALIAAGMWTTSWWHVAPIGSLALRTYELAPGFGALAPRWVLLFCFMQSVHYGVWLRWVPDEDRPQPTPRTFAATARELSRDLGVPLVMLVVVLTIAVALWGVVDMHGARAAYLSVAPFHAQLELAVAVLWWLEGRTT